MPIDARPEDRSHTLYARMRIANNPNYRDRGDSVLLDNRITYELVAAPSDQPPGKDKEGVLAIGHPDTGGAVKGKKLNPEESITVNGIIFQATT